MKQFIYELFIKQYNDDKVTSLKRLHYFIMNAVMNDDHKTIVQVCNDCLKDKNTDINILKIILICISSYQYANRDLREAATKLQRSFDKKYNEALQLQKQD